MLGFSALGDENRTKYAQLLSPGMELLRTDLTLEHLRAVSTNNIKKRPGKKPEYNWTDEKIIQLIATFT
jgi:hypothetical protein